jgi:hypothetical protein
VLDVFATIRRQERVRDGRLDLSFLKPWKQITDDIDDARVFGGIHGKDGFRSL